MEIKQTFLRVCALLFILPSLLLPSWSMDVEKAVAKSLLAPPPLTLIQHKVYQPYDPKWATRLSWETDIDFVNTGIRARWIFRVQQEVKPNSNNWVLTDEFIQSVPCTTQGEVIIMAGQAIFNPKTQDHIVCQLPSFRKIVEQMQYIDTTGKPITLMRVCTKCLDPWLAADVQVEAVGQKEYPITYLKSIEKINGQKPVFQSQIERIKGVYALKTSISGATPQWSTPVNIEKQQKYWSGLNPNYFVQTLKDRANHPQSSVWTEYWANSPLIPYVQSNNLGTQDWLSWAESNNNDQATSSVKDYQMSTGPMTLYIGHNPESGKYFSGTMYSIGVDPACVGY